MCKPDDNDNNNNKNQTTTSPSSKNSSAGNSNGSKIVDTSPRSVMTTTATTLTMTTTVIPDEPRDFDTSKRIYPKEYEGHFSSLMIPKEEISDKVQSIAKQIQNDYAGKRPVLLCVLKGATPFYQHLLDAMEDLGQGFYTEYIRASSYEGTESTGTVQVGGGADFANLTGKDIIIVEDIVDTGTTMSQLIPVLQKKAQPKSVEVVSLLSKRLDKPVKYKAKYVGFSIPNHFIVGYGLDYNELYRDTKDIWIISQAGIDFDASTLH